MRLGRRLVELPPGVDVVEFVRHDGMPPARADAIPPAVELTLGACRDRYLETDRRSLEDGTIDGIDPHIKHLVGVSGSDSRSAT